MRRRDKTGGKATKTQRRQTVRRRNAPKTARRRKPPAADATERFALLTRERDEALEQQTATSEVLKAISRSTFDLQTVLNMLVETAARLCHADKASIRLVRDGLFHHVASYGYTLEQHHYMNEHPVAAKPDRGSIVGRVLIDGKAAQIEDTKADPDFRVTNVPGFENVHTTLGVPLLREEKPIGALVLMRGRVECFTDKQIALVQNFAAQAVIAIENARLLSELRESLDHQTATADILRVIASAPEDSKRALDTIAETAVRMFDAANVNFRRIEGDVLCIIGAAGPTMGRVREALPDLPLEPTDPAVRAVFDNRQIHIEDRRVVLANERGEIARVLRDLPVRSQAFTPLSRQGEAIGVMIVSRSEVRSFEQDELDLMTGFADQAVIAIENARLLNELQESLQQQTATADVLGVISRSSGDLGPVFASILGNATRICEADFGGLFLSEGPGFRSVAQQGPLLDWWKQDPFFDVRRHPGLPLSRVARSKSVVHVANLAAEAASHADDPRFVALVETAGARTVLGVPLLKDDNLVGAIIIYRSEMRLFSDKQVELVRNFASQAVIAIENARLLNELRQSTTDLTQSLENLQTAQDRLVQTEKLASLGQQTSFVAAASLYQGNLHHLISMC